jgi:ABC-type phosphate/phosphonate transport system substrate-binding protein
MTGRRRFLLGCGASLAAAGRGMADRVPEADGKVRVAVSAAMLGDVNENDARASIIVWADVLSRQSGLSVEYDRNILVTTAGLAEAVRRFQLDAFAITTTEYTQLSQFVQPNTYVVDETTGAKGSEYVVVAHRNKGIRTLADLKGRRLMIQKSPQTCLAQAWLDAAMATLSPGGFDRYLGAVEHHVKLSKVVLPVFFQQADAGVAQLRSFQISSELNPQLSRDLQVVAKSPPLACGMLGFHRLCPAARRDSFRAALLNLHHTTAGKQALMMFQSGRLVAGDQSTFQSALEILAVSDRVRGQAARKQGGTA